MYGLLFAGLLGFAAAVPVQHLNTSTNAAFANVSVKAATSAWWYANIDHTGDAVRDYVPFLQSGDNADDDYTTYIAVDAGDAAGFTNALYSGGPNGDRDNMWISGEPRTIYLPPGTYTLNKTVYMDTDTVIIGDAVNPPTIAASNGFDGDYLLVGGADGDDGHGESHFSVMIKNVILDTTANSDNSGFAALSWRVAQNSALVNVQINMPQGAHTGLYIGQGSTIQVGDVTFRNGTNGIHWDDHQQATLKNMKFTDCSTGILIDKGKTLNIFASTFDTVGKPVVYNTGDPMPWVSVVDAKATNSGDFFTSNVDSPQFMLENISKDNTNSAMVTVNGDVKLDGTVQTVGTYVVGNVYGADPVDQTSPNNTDLARNKVLAPDTAYPVVSANQYTDATVDQVINLKDTNQNGGQTLKGDGKTNDGPALQSALDYAAQQNKIAYLPYGIYVTEQTIAIPVGTRLVGNGWSTISGTGSAFTDESNPTPIVQIGKPNDVGTCDIQDMRFTVGDKLPGAIVVQVNMAGNAPGDVAIHNSLITIGGTRDTNLTCDAEADCKAAFIGLQLAEGSSAYIDNFWNWVADHSSDDSGKGYHSAAKTGVVIESTKGTWLSGMGSEHWWLSQISYINASNVFVSLFQSETNYNQGSAATTTPPDPWTPANTDPDFSWCDGQDVCPMGAAQYFDGGSEIYSYSSGSWNFYGGDQANMNVIKTSPTALKLYGLCTHMANYVMRLPDGTRFGNGDADHFGGSWGSLVAEYTS